MQVNNIILGTIVIGMIILGKYSIKHCKNKREKVFILSRFYESPYATKEYGFQFRVQKKKTKIRNKERDQKNERMQGENEWESQSFVSIPTNYPSKWKKSISITLFLFSHKKKHTVPNIDDLPKPCFVVTQEGYFAKYGNQPPN